MFFFISAGKILRFAGLHMRSSAYLPQQILPLDPCYQCLSVVSVFLRGLRFICAHPRESAAMFCSSPCLRGEN